MQTALIDGTAYKVSAGKALIDGTAYAVSSGQTLIDGTVHAITFATVTAALTITITGEGAYANNDKMYIEIPGGLSTKIITNAGTHTIQRGKEIKAVVSRGRYIMMNGEQVAHAPMTKPSASYTFAAETDITVYFGEVDGKEGVHITTT